MQQSQEWGNFLARKWSNQREFLAGALGAECAWCLDNIVRGEQADLSVLQQTREQVDEMSLHNYQKRFAINILDTAISLQETVNNMQPAIQRAVQRVLDDHGQN